MSQPDTVRTMGRGALVLAVVSVCALAQSPPVTTWRPVGNTLRLMGLPSPAGGPVERLWFSADGRLHLLLADGRRFATRNWETWEASLEGAPAQSRERVRAASVFEGQGLFALRSPSGSLYAAGEHLHRSRDEGRTWENLTEWQGSSLLGAPVRDLAPDPGDDQRVAVATATGIWLTHDGGRTWIGLNEGLPNLPVLRLLQLPENGRPLRVAAESGAGVEILDWLPGQRAGWVPAPGEDPLRALRVRWSERLGMTVHAAAASGDLIYLGSESAIRTSPDGGRTWRSFPLKASSVERFWLDSEDGRTALAAIRTPDGRGAILRTLNGGIWWDDLTANLPAASIGGVTADRETGSIYVATSQGLWWTVADLRAPSPATQWAPLQGLPPAAPVRDVMLDAAAVRLFAAVAGHGVWVAPAPHRQLRPAAVHTADFGLRAAAPGALLSVFGAVATEASAGGRPAPVLATEAAETQLQIPYEVTGDTLILALGGIAAPLSLPLRESAPAVLTDRDGTPMLLDAETGIPLDAANPGRPGMTIQILATGLGRTDPEWPAGVPAPLEAPPAVKARVRVVLDGQELPIVRATLAPGYTGYYLVEARLPEFLDRGLSVLVVEAGGNPSAPAGIHLEP